MTDHAAGHKSPSVQGLSARPAVQILRICAWIVRGTVRKIITFCRIGELYLTITGVKSAGVDF